MEDKFDLHNCGNEDALSFGNAMLKVEKLKETVNGVWSGCISLWQIYQIES
ncbi:hypothetical protein QUB70_20775 [Microcoleus sp. A003_D6]|uniref:hypothetical protein n=1 Tax=Microcoleus sp. A003_D6 TaxID=3055266 RepID=UPI002FCEEC05